MHIKISHNVRFSTFRLVCRLIHEAPELNLAQDLCNNLQRTVDKECSDSLLEPLQNIEINMHPAVFDLLQPEAATDEAAMRLLME